MAYKTDFTCIVTALQHKQNPYGIPIGFPTNQELQVQRNGELIGEMTRVVLRTPAYLLVNLVLITAHDGAANGSE